MKKIQIGTKRFDKFECKLFGIGVHIQPYSNFLQLTWTSDQLETFKIGKLGVERTKKGNAYIVGAYIPALVSTTIDKLPEPLQLDTYETLLRHTDTENDVYESIQINVDYCKAYVKAKEAAYDTFHKTLSDEIGNHIHD